MTFGTMHLQHPPPPATFLANAQSAMTQLEKLLLQILRGTSDNNIGFDDLCRLLTQLGFAVRIKGSHHMFSKEGVAELINLQRDGAKAKPYQNKQLRQIIVKYKLEV